MIRNSFEMGPEGWCSYDYHASVIAGRNIFILTTWEPKGGVNDSGYIWTTHHRWSADTPETPVSILALIFYRNWVNLPTIDLRGAQVSVYLRGDGLQLHGAKCYFWVVASNNTRWHLTSAPLAISDGCWATEPSRFVLVNDESKWHRSWSKDPMKPLSLNDTLANVESYGFAFVGFSSEVSGRLAMDEFELQLAGE